MFAIVKDNKVVQYVQPNTVFHVNWVEYGANWIATATQAQKDAIGLVEVVHGARQDERYYWVTQQEPAYDAGAKLVRINYTATPKDLDQLKTTLVSQTNQAAYTTLLPSDWMVVKSVETGTAVPADWAAWRQAVRTAAANHCAAINACADVDALAALGQAQWPAQPGQIKEAA